MVGLGVNRAGLRVGLARSVHLPRRSQCFVRAAQTTTSPVTVKKLDEDSGKYLVNYEGEFNPRFKKRVLSIDGGGVRGLVPATVLITVEKVLAEYLLENYRDQLPPGISANDIEVDVADYFDIISGTSVGSIVALYVGTKGGDSRELLKEIGSTARPGSAQGIVDIIYNRADLVFQSPWYASIPVIGNGILNSKVLLKPKFSADGLETLLQKAFGDLTLRDARTRVLVPAFNITQNTALSFWGGNGLAGTVETVNHVDDHKQARKDARLKTTLERPQPMLQPLVISRDGKPPQLIPDIVIDWNKDYKLWQVARASAAAPTFFPAAVIDPIYRTSPAEESESGESDYFVDGGIIANNPTMQALTMAFTEMKNENVSDPDVSDVAVLSLGTGSTLPETGNLGNAGAYQWLVSGALLGTMMDGTSRYLQALIDDLYHRLNKESTILGQYVRIDDIDEYTDEDAAVLRVMDDPKNVGKLKEIGDRLGHESRAIIRDHVELCLARKDS